MSRQLAVLLALPLVLIGDPPGRPADQQALKPYGSLVGEWRGTGQTQRGSARGAWTETGQWAWSLTRDHAALAFHADKGKHLRSAVLRPAAKAGDFVLEGTLPDGTTRTFRGATGPRQALILTSEKPHETGPTRITLTPLHDTRFTLLFEGGTGTSYSRIGEVGFTRQGVAFAAGESGPACIVTEGRGTTEVKYKGKTYYVCCSGCRDLFNEDPEGVIAEAARRSKAR